MARVALDADVVIAFLDPGDREHATAVAELRPRLAAGDKLLVAATVYAESTVRPLQNGTDALTLDKKLGRIARRVARHPDDLRRELSRRGFRALQEEPGVTPVDARQE